MNTDKILRIIKTNRVYPYSCLDSDQHKSVVNPLLISLILAFHFCNSPQIDSFQYTGLADDSVLTLEDYKKDSEGIISEHNGWYPIIQKSFHKLSPELNLNVSIVKKDTFNMAFYPENHFLINTETLDVLDREYKFLQSEFSELKNCKNLNACREISISPIIAHELAHFYQRDQELLLIKLEANSHLPEKEKQENIFLFKRERELAADKYAESILARNGYNPRLQLLPLKILKKLNQEKNKNTQLRMDYFLSSHPSPNERLFNLEKDNKYYTLKNIELAFHLIARGTNRESLKEAISILEDTLHYFPENLELKRATVTAYHRYWMYTASTAELKFIPIIDQPLFSDSEEFNAKKGTHKIPGDEKIYKKTLILYEELYDKLKHTDMGFISNYSVLLVYSDREENKKKSLDLAMEAFKKKKSMKTLNNLGIVYILNGNTIEGLKSFWNEIPEVDRANIQEPVSQNELSFKLEQNLAVVPKQEVESRFIALANFTLANYYLNTEDNTKNAELLKKKYFYPGDKPSPWVVYINDYAEQNH